MNRAAPVEGRQTESSSNRTVASTLQPSDTGTASVRWRVAVPTLGEPTLRDERGDYCCATSRQTCEDPHGHGQENETHHAGIDVNSSGCLLVFYATFRSHRLDPGLSPLSEY